MQPGTCLGSEFQREGEPINMVLSSQVLVLSFADKRRRRAISERVCEVGIGLVMDEQRISGCIRVYIGLLDVIKAGVRVSAAREGE